MSSPSSLTVGIVDYGMGNIASIKSAISYLGHRPIVSNAYAELAKCDRLVLPGVGSFNRAMQNIRGLQLDTAITEIVKNGTPLLGICLGMQLLATSGTEHGDTAGLGLIEGVVRRLPGLTLPVPHIGFSSITFSEKAAFYRNHCGEHTDFYFVHSYRFEPVYLEDVGAVSDYEGPFGAMVKRANVVGTQFHPEKSQSNGLKLLEALFSYELFNAQ